MLSYLSHRDGKTTANSHGAKFFSFSNLKTPAIAAISENIANGIKQYIDGEILEGDVADIIRIAYRDIEQISANMDLARNDTDKILEDLYIHFMISATQACYYAYQDEGISIAAQDGLSAADRYVYYNARYYYAFKELKQTCSDTLSEIAADNKPNDFNWMAECQKLEPVHRDFNELWKVDAIVTKEICFMRDTSIELPNDFIFYYAADLFSAKDREDATIYTFSAYNPHYGPIDNVAGYSYAVLLPRTASLLKETALAELRSRFSVSEQVWIDDLLELDGNFNTAFHSFIKENLSNLYFGKITAWNRKGAQSYDVPFDDFGAPNSFLAKELIRNDEYSDYLDNFVFSRKL